jgi:hypothetical protein
MDWPMKTPKPPGVTLLGCMGSSSVGASLQLAASGSLGGGLVLRDRAACGPLHRSAWRPFAWLEVVSASDGYAA